MSTNMFQTLSCKIFYFPLVTINAATKHFSIPTVRIFLGCKVGKCTVICKKVGKFSISFQLWCLRKNFDGWKNDNKPVKAENFVSSKEEYKGN